jgi:D-inositol-3-phosphate glycosyltransferase
VNPRVLLISEHGDPLAPLGTIQAGGQNVYVRELAIALARRGYAVDVATHLSTAALPIREEPFPGVQILRFDAGRPGFVPKEELLGLAPVFTQQLADYVERSGSYPALIHSNYWISGLMGLDLRHRWDIPQVHTFHSLGKVRLHNGTEKRSYAGVRLQIEQLLLHTADAILASNPVEADLLAANYRVRCRNRSAPCSWPGALKRTRDSPCCCRPCRSSSTTTLTCVTGSGCTWRAAARSMAAR